MVTDELQWWSEWWSNGELGGGSRCLLAEGHAEEHQGPTEVEWQAYYDAMQSARRKRTA